MHPGDVLTGEGDHVAVLTDGTATIDGVEHSWSTVGLYRFHDDGLLAACWLLPLDTREFDAVWQRSSSTTAKIVRARTFRPERPHATFGRRRGRTLFRRITPGRGRRTPPPRS